jgi:valyl-tRNA synthetase
MLEKTYRPPEVESKHYRRWEEAGAFAANPNSDRRPYTIMMPPPNVTGSLHIGHALTFTVQDILIRFHRMAARDALWQPGTDHAGIATQMVVERQLAEQGLSRRQLGREKFLERVWGWKEQSGGTITKQLRHLGASADWPRERFTMDEGLSHAVRKVFVELYRQGLIYKDQRLVNWDPKLHTAISDLEVQQREVTGKLWHIRYPVTGEEGHYLVVATTRPETMLGDTGVAVHPDDARYQDLIGKTVVLPLVGREIPVVADEHADPETGSGAVKITPAHDFNDFEVVPHGDRGGVPLEPWLTVQWYADAATLAKPAIEAVEDGRTRIIPKRWENTYFEWMRNIQPWCISRQLWWGHQIPAWYGPDGEIFVEPSEAEAEAAAAKHYGHPVELMRDPDVLDTWFSSALWPFSTLGWPEETPELTRYYPGDVLVTGFDIIFFWVARMMMMGLHFMGEVPFHTVYIHGLVRDEAGQKMSKSKDNVIDPLVIVEQFGSDALRFTLAALSIPAGQDVKLAQSRIEGYRNFATKLWNAARFCEMNEAKLDADFDPAGVRAPLNRWIVSALARNGQEMREAFEAYRFNDAANGIYHFVWHSFCDWYLEFAKPVLSGDDEAEKQETRATMAWALGQIVHQLHPIMPFITEEIWSNLTDAEGGLLITADWPGTDETLLDDEASAEMEWVIRLISNVRALRAEVNVPAASRVDLLLRDPGPMVRARIDRHLGLIKRLARIETLECAAQAIPEGAVQVMVDDVVGYLPLAQVIDIDAERGRLEKELGKIATEAAKLEKKLGNEQFLAKAPEAVVSEQRERLEAAKAAADKLAAALERLKAA